MAWLTEVCRLCLSQDRVMIPIFNEDYYKQLASSLHTKISSVADLQMSPGDGLPVLACDECCRQVDASYEFRLRCHQSDTQLRQFVDDPPLEIMNAPDVKQEIEIVENGFDMGFPEEVDINEDGSSNEASDAEELESPDPLGGVDPLGSGGGVVRLKSEFGPQLGTQSEDSLGSETATPSKQHHKRARKQNLSKVNDEASFLHDTDPSYMLALGDPSSSPAVNSTTGDEASDEFNCFICPARYLKKSYFLNHLKKHVNNNRQNEDGANREVNERLHVNINSLRGGTGKTGGANESRKKDSIPNFVCEICNSPYTLRRNYLKHLKFIHAVDRPPVGSPHRDIDDADEEEFGDDVPHADRIESLRGIIEIDPQLNGQICTCTVCKTTFPTLSTLIEHNLAMHSTREMSKCSFCRRKFFTLVSFMRHFKVHTLAKKFNCLECRARFVTEHHLKLHVSVTHNRGCPVCGKPLKRKSDLSIHLKTHDPPPPEGTGAKKPRRKWVSQVEVIEGPATPDGEPVASTSSEKPRPRMSKIEGTLKTKNYFSQVYQTCLRKQNALKKTSKIVGGKKKKIRKEVGVQKEPGLKLTPPKEITKIVFGHKIKAHKEITKKKRDRKIIKMEKNRPKMIKTEKNKVTIKMGSLDIKKAKMKMGQSDIKKDGGKTSQPGSKKKTVKMGPSQIKKSKFLTEVSVENVARAEENIRIAKLSGKNDCMFCTKHFMGISKLKRHILIHTGERPFECEVCDRRFNQKPSLKMHIIVCHTAYKPFPCSQCTQTFSRQNLLLNHLEKHHNV